MSGVCLALALAAAGPGLSARLPPAPVDLFHVVWHRPLVQAEPLAGTPLEPGGVAVDPGPAHLALLGTRDGWLHAFRADGTLAWEFQAGGGFAAPPAVDGDTVYAGASDGKLYALALATGKERWRYDAKEELGTRPAVAGGLVLVASLSDTLFAVDARTGAWRWHHRRESRSGFSIRGAASPQVLGDTVFAGYSDGTVAALEVATGGVRWERQVAPAGDYLDVDSLRVDGTRLYAAAYSGAVLALDARTGEAAWTFKAPGASRVAVAGGLVVAVTANTVYGLAQTSGAPLWSTPLDGAPAGEPAVAGKWLVIPANQGGLRWLEPASGRTLRIFDPGTGIAGAVGVAGGRVYVLSNGGDLFALDLS